MNVTRLEKIKTIAGPQGPLREPIGMRHVRMRIDPGRRVDRRSSRISVTSLCFHSRRSPRARIRVGLGTISTQPRSAAGSMKDGTRHLLLRPDQAKISRSLAANALGSPG